MSAPSTAPAFVTCGLLSLIPKKRSVLLAFFRTTHSVSSPVAIYAWENEKCKNIPCIENFDILSKLYKCHVEDLYVLKQIDLQVRENTPEYQTYRTLVNQLLEGLADIEEGRVQDFEQTMKEIRKELEI